MNPLESVADVYSKLWYKQREAIIAGGFPRDMHLGKEWKDVDIYTTAPKGNIRRIITQIVGRAPLFMFDGDRSYTENPNVRYVAQVKHPNTGVMFDFIGVYMSPVDYINKFFDFNLCKIHIHRNNGFMKIEVPSCAQKDIDNETLTMTVNKEMDSHSVGKALLEHYHRLHKKYPDYELVVEVE